jgi:oxygen-independent coproporphyrinogen III oxidase
MLSAASAATPGWVSDDSSIGLYVHIPFCAAICHYCNFNRGLLDDELKARYVSAIAADVSRQGDGSEVGTIYFGGGTPSLLDPSEIATLVDVCTRAFRVRLGAEITLETNPETVTVERMRGFRDAGINRVSMGVQSFKDEELKRLGRAHSAERAIAAVDDTRRAGIDNISLDLMMWLPRQSVEAWLESVRALIAIAPEHASLYLLELYPHSPLREEMARGEWTQAPDEDAATMYLEALARLEASGYVQYEISNVARPGRWSRHNLKYWTDGEWHAFGCGAHGTRNGRRWRNVSSTSEYVDRVGRHESVVVESRCLDAITRAEEAAITGLRLTAGLPLDLFRARYGVDVLERYGSGLAPFFEAGCLTLEDGCLRLSPAGMLIANEVWAVFV